jgi:hypothetical protein
MRVLVACEFSGVVRQAFRARGHDAWSCDLLPSTDASEFHIQGDIFGMAYSLVDQDWDLMIAHPPCTYLSNMSNCRIKEPGRLEARMKAMDFFLELAWVGIHKIAIENPRGFPERIYRKADQIIHPYQFGHPQSKATCLWLKNLPLLVPTKIVEPKRKWDGKRWRTFVDGVSNWRGDAAKMRSVTFSGIADAMAAQWGG